MKMPSNVIGMVVMPGFQGRYEHMTVPAERPVAALNTERLSDPLVAPVRPCATASTTFCPIGSDSGTWYASLAEPLRSVTAFPAGAPTILNVTVTPETATL